MEEWEWEKEAAEKRTCEPGVQKVRLYPVESEEPHAW